MSKPKYNHAGVIAFSFDSDNVADKVTKEELLSALCIRTSTLIKEWEPEAIDIFDTYKNE